MRFDPRESRALRFSVNHRALIDGRWYSVLRHDNVHGQPHVHREWRAEGKRIGELHDMDNVAGLGSLGAEAWRDIAENWIAYRRRMVKRLEEE